MQCLGQPFALTATHTFLILLMRYLAAIRDAGSASRSVEADAVVPHERDERGMVRLVPDASAPECRMPPLWAGSGGDGRAREGRDKVWIVADVVLAVKVSLLGITIKVPLVSVPR
jgi:hypothetical protein